MRKNRTFVPTSTQTPHVARRSLHSCGSSSRQLAPVPALQLGSHKTATIETLLYEYKRLASVPLVCNATAGFKETCGQAMRHTSSNTLRATALLSFREWFEAKEQCIRLRRARLVLAFTLKVSCDSDQCLLHRYAFCFSVMRTHSSAVSSVVQIAQPLTFKVMRTKREYTPSSCHPTRSFEQASCATGDRPQFGASWW